MKKQEEFVKVIQQNAGLIFKTASLFTTSKEDREDLVQEITYQLWKSFDSFQERAKRSTWIYRVAMNVAIYHLNKAKKSLPTLPINSTVLNVQENYDGGKEEQWRVLQKHIAGLNLLEKGILMLHLENKSYAEIAEIIDISVSNVGTKLSRIKQKLKKEITKYQ